MTRPPDWDAALDAGHQRAALFPCGCGCGCDDQWSNYQKLNLFGADHVAISAPPWETCTLEDD